VNSLPDRLLRQPPWLGLINADWLSQAGTAITSIPVGGVSSGYCLAGLGLGVVQLEAFQWGRHCGRATGAGSITLTHVPAQQTELAETIPARSPASDLRRWRSARAKGLAILAGRGSPGGRRGVGIA